MKKSLTLVFALCAFAAFAPAATFDFVAYLDGPSENPPNAVPGTGWALLTWDDIAMTYRLQTSWSGLVGTVTVAHIHCCIAPPGNVGVATPTPTFPGFPAGVTAGSYDQTFDYTQTTSFNGTFVTNNGGTAAGAAAALLKGLNEGTAYLNIHSTFDTAGEIRGFFAPVPEPGTYALAGVALAALLAFRKR